MSQTIRDLLVGSAIELAPCGSRLFEGAGDCDVFTVAADDRSHGEGAFT